MRDKACHNKKGVPCHQVWYSDFKNILDGADIPARVETADL